MSSVIARDVALDTRHATRDWQMVRVGDLFDIQQGKALSAPARTASDKVPFLRTANVLWNEVDLSSVDSMGMSTAERKRFRLAPGDLLVCEGGEIGRSAVWNGEIQDCYHQNHIHRLRPRGESDPEFYQYWLRYAFTLTDLYSGTGTRTTIANLSQGRLAGLMVPAPPIGEQRDIARMLTAIRQAESNAVRRARASSAAAASYRRSFLQAARKSGQIVRLSELDCEISTGPFGSQLHAHEYVQSGVRVINPMHLRRNGITTSITPCVDTETAIRLRRHRLEEGDVIVPRRGDLDRFAWIGPGMAGDLCGTGCMVIRNGDTRVTSRFLAEYYGSEEAQRFLGEAAGGTIMPNINPKILSSLPIVIPPVRAQHEFTAASAAFDRDETAGADCTTALQGLFKAALKKVFTRV